MIVKPSVSELLTKVNNRYELVIASLALHNENRRLPIPYHYQSDTGLSGALFCCWSLPAAD